MEDYREKFVRDYNEKCNGEYRVKSINTDFAVVKSLKTGCEIKISIERPRHELDGFTVMDVLCEHSSLETYNTDRNMGILKQRIEQADVELVSKGRGE